MAEIGVHHGKLFVLLTLCLRSGEISVAVDVFENQQLNLDQSGNGNREIFLWNLRKWVPDAVVKILRKSSLEVQPAEILDVCGRVRLASIDGGHTEACVLNDLRLVETVLTPRGAVILDDCFNQAWPGVSSATAKYLLDNSALLRPFAISPNKLYLTHGDNVAFYRRELRSKSAYYYEKTACFLDHDVDIYGTFDFTFSVKRRMIESVKRSRLGPYARAFYAHIRS